MKKKVLLIFTFLLLAVCLYTTAYAHSGRTDSNGGHYDRETGEYHYHHGYPAHDHDGGVCLYDYDDRTGWNSGTSNGSNGSSSWGATPEPKPTLAQPLVRNNAEHINDKSNPDTWDALDYIVFTVFIVSPMAYAVIFIAMMIVTAFKDARAKKRQEAEKKRYDRNNLPKNKLSILSSTEIKRCPRLSLLLTMP